MDYSWKDDYKIGLYFVDSQHRSLFDLLDETDKAIKAHDVDVEQVIRKLDGYAKVHFQTEEDNFEKYNFPHLEEHKALHKIFVDKVESLLKLAKTDGERALTETVEFLIGWLKNHIIAEDVKYVPYLKDAQATEEKFNEGAEDE